MAARFAGLGLGLWATGWLAGCSAVPVSEMGGLAKPNAVFVDTAVFRYESGLAPQIEPGAASTGGGAVAGCTSCK